MAVMVGAKPWAEPLVPTSHPLLCLVLRLYAQVPVLPRQAWEMMS